MYGYNQQCNDGLNNSLYSGNINIGNIFCLTIDKSEQSNESRRWALQFAFLPKSLLDAPTFQGCTRSAMEFMETDALTLSGTFAYILWSNNKFAANLGQDITPTHSESWRCLFKSV